MPQKIFFAGLTAAGKTTHSKLLASEFDLHYVSASSMLLGYAKFDASTLPKDFWVSSTSYSLRQQRKNDQFMDRLVDQQLIHMAANMDQLVFDSWGSPWLSSTPGLRIWLASSLETRWWKATISHESIFDPHSKEVLNEIIQKDNDTRDYFFSNYGFDIFQDHQVFDYIVDISSFITAPMEKSSQISIARVQELLSTTVHYEFQPTIANVENMRTIIKKYGSGIFHKVPEKLVHYL